jgi:hypothetical protein
LVEQQEALTGRVLSLQKLHCAMELVLLREVLFSMKVTRLGEYYPE